MKLVLGIVFWIIAGVQAVALSLMLFLTVAAGQRMAQNGDVAGAIERDLLPPILWLTVAIVVFFIRRTAAVRTIALAMAAAPLVFISLSLNGGLVHQEIDPASGRIVSENVVAQAGRDLTPAAWQSGAMTPPARDVLAIGNAIVDVIAPADEALVAAAGLVKGSMRLIGADEALALHARMADAREVSGGSAANTAVGVAALGGEAGFVGLAGADEMGALFTRELHAAGVDFTVPPAGDGTPTARCLILVTGDGQRSMCTFPGAAHRLAVEHVEAEQVAGSSLLFLEGYLWDSDSARAAMEHAIGIARAAGRKVALTPSDIACIARQGERFRALIAAGQVDLLFVNDAELAALGDPDELAARVEVLVVTHGAGGATAVRASERVSAPAAPAARVVDTTGAGDLFAAGFLFGHARGLKLGDSLAIGARAAAAVIADYGARPAGDLRHLVKG